VYLGPDGTIYDVNYVPVKPEDWEREETQPSELFHELTLYLHPF
jgi:hypothetical protein